MSLSSGCEPALLLLGRAVLGEDLRVAGVRRRAVERHRRHERPRPMSSQSIPYSQLVRPGPCSSSGRKRFHSPSAFARSRSSTMIVRVGDARARPPRRARACASASTGIDVLVHELADALAEVLDAVGRREVHRRGDYRQYLIGYSAILSTNFIDYGSTRPRTHLRRAVRDRRVAGAQALARAVPRRRRRPQLPGALPRRAALHLADPLGPDRRHRLPRPRPLRRRGARDPRARARGAPAPRRRRREVREYGPGETFTIEASEIHRVVHVGDEPALTVHAYSPPLTRMGAYMVEDDGTLTRHSVSHETELRSSPDRVVVRVVDRRPAIDAERRLAPARRRHERSRIALARAGAERRPRRQRLLGRRAQRLGDPQPAQRPVVTAQQVEQVAVDRRAVGLPRPTASIAAAWDPTRWPSRSRREVHRRPRRRCSRSASPPR